MVFLCRIAGRGLIWIGAIATALVCCEVASAVHGARPVPDAAKPLPGLSPETLGPSLDEVIERLSRKGPEWACPPGVVE